MNRIPYKEREKVYTNALIANGDKIQNIVAIEELSECIKEVCKVMRGKGNLDHLAEEVADATIVLEQVRLFFGIKETVSRKIDEKIQRLNNDLQRSVSR